MISKPRHGKKQYNDEEREELNEVRRDASIRQWWGRWTGQDLRRRYTDTVCIPICTEYISREREEAEVFQFGRREEEKKKKKGEKSPGGGDSFH